ncbi:NAD(P)/FAD-dependent oxidoreductase [Diaminobutyricimonas sp. LJ205]|uniref:NAD(P)/FAD-dependent oxidoreductase n=1 Tax=Diaminobutyricimonas sp. LJ205 TaxID=2683590 RepID=UPI0012F4867C|nr:FAD-dependent oxidoreductase [Diaminobutyricimonas sp. LJ205]
MSVASFVIIGGGLAGASAAGTLRKEGFDGDIRLLAAEPHLPYIRPPLSKEYFLGKAERDSVFVHPAAWYAEHDIDVDAATKVTAIDPPAHRVSLDDGSSVRYDRLLLATGASPRRVEVPGSGAVGIHYLRTIEDSERLRSELEVGGREVVLVGAGWIGLEVAAAARGYGNHVTAIGRETVPLQGPLGDELGGMFQRLHEQNGVEFRLPADLVEFSSQDGRVSSVLTDAGTLPADLVVVGVGAIPNTALAEAGGLAVSNGVLVDETLASSDPDIFAAGDVANAYHPVIGQRMRNEHWANARASGRVAARSMLGQRVVFDDIPYFYTDQYDLGMEYSGYPPLTGDARLVYRGDVDAREFIAFWLAGDRVVAGMNVNVWDVNEQVQNLIRSGRQVDAARLSDPAVPLEEVLAA